MIHRCKYTGKTFSDRDMRDSCEKEYEQNQIRGAMKSVMETHHETLKKLDDNVSKKFDNGKAPMSLIPKSALLAAANVLAFGAKKYDPHNWRKSGFNWSRLLDATLRHLQEWNDGTDLDKESSLNHVHHALVNLMFLCEHIEKNLGKDDRYRPDESN